MALPTETVNIDISLATGAEYAEAYMEFVLSGPDADSNGYSIPPQVTRVELDSSGQAAVELWPVDRGVHGRYYTPVVHGIRTGQNIRETHKMGRIQPLDGDGPITLAALQREGGDAIEGTFYRVMSASEYAALIAAASEVEAASNAILAAGAGADIYEDTTAGLAGTSDGETFLVIENGGLALYENDTGTAVFVDRIGLPVFPSVASLAASAALIDGAVYTVSAGDNGKGEHFTYDDDSTATADGALVVTATGMGAGRLISDRTEYANYAELDADARTLPAGTALHVRGVGNYTVVASSQDMTLTGGLKLVVADSEATPQHYGATGTATTDTAAFTALAANHTNIRIRYRFAPYLINDTIDIDDNQHWHWEGGAKAVNQISTKRMFEASGVVEWSFTGRPHLVGTRTAYAQSDAEAGIAVVGCRRYVVENLIATDFRGAGILVTGSAATPELEQTYSGNDLRVHSDRGQWNNCSAFRNRRGALVSDGAGGEYCIFTNFIASQNDDGIDVDAGNVRWVGGNVGDNYNGVLLRAVGSNHGHGGMHGLNINHNFVSNLISYGVDLGYTIQGCHFYGNPSVSATSGYIWLKDSAGVRFQDCVIDCKFYNDGAGNAGAGANYVTDCYFPTNHQGSAQKNTSFSTNDSSLHTLYITGCRTKTGLATENAPAHVFVSGQLSAAQSITAATLTRVEWDTFGVDNRNRMNQYNDGEFVCAVDGWYEFTVSVFVNVTTPGDAYGQFTTGAGSPVAHSFAPGAKSATGAVIIAGTAKMYLVAGTQVDFRVNVAGTSPEIQTAGTKMTIRSLAA